MPRGVFVELLVKYSNHTFRRVSYTDRRPKGRDAGYVSMEEDPTVGVEYFHVLQPTDRLDYEDITTANVTVELAGGLCNRTLGTAEIFFTRQAECGLNFRLTRNLTRFSNVLTLPAHRFDYTFGALRTNVPSFNLAVRDYLIRANNNSGEFDLVNISDSTINRWARFEYHPLPTLTLSFNASDSNRCSSTRVAPFFVMKGLTATKATISLSENYPSSLSPRVLSCSNIEGVVNITNLLGEDDADELLSVCREPCSKPVFTDATVSTSLVNVCAINRPEGSRAEIRCPSNGTISSITFAHYGSMPSGACLGGFVFNASSGCRGPKSNSVVQNECLGKQSCSVLSDDAKFGGDPCNGSASFLTIQAVCRIERLVYENARVELELRVGYPNRFGNFSKEFKASMSVLGYIDDISLVSIVELFWHILFDSCSFVQDSHVLVTGLKWISDSYSVPFPQYMPLMVLHDPPGGIKHI